MVHRKIQFGDLPEVKGGMEFRLTYAGELNATQRDPLPGQPPKHTLNRQHIRRLLHVQLKKLWESIVARRDKVNLFTWTDDLAPPAPPTTIAELSAKYAKYGFQFVPLVTQELDLICELDILFLRSGRPGSVVWPGDIDNRLKTLLDAMTIPLLGENYAAKTPTVDEAPFFCLFADDSLITKISAETDDMLQPINGKTVVEPADCQLVITVKIQPYHRTPWNAHFG